MGDNYLSRTARAHWLIDSPYGIQTMKILWIGREVINTDGGDAVFDRKMVSQLQKRHDVVSMSVARNSIGKRLGRMIMEFIPQDRAGFGTKSDVEKIIARIVREQVDAVVVSHEHLDHLGSRLQPVVTDLMGFGIVLINHNVTSSAMQEIFGGLSGEVLRKMYVAYERRILKNISVAIALSHEDKRLLMMLSGRSNVMVAHPGAPRQCELSESAAIKAELLLLGTYDWYPKRWSLQKFAEEWAAMNEPPAQIYVDESLDAATRRKLRARLIGTVELSDGVRFGMLTDRFRAGHKLKTAWYIMNNCIVLTFADVRADFEFSRHAPFFIRKIMNLKEVPSIMDEVASVPSCELRESLSEFKSEIAAALSWERQSHVLEQAIVVARQCAR